MQMKKILEVPKVSQRRNYCGPASLSMVFAYYNLNLTQEQIANEITAMFERYKKRPINKEGMTPTHMIAYTRSKGFWVDFYNHSSLQKLIELIDEGIPPIVMTDHFQSRRVNHFSVAIGYDLEAKVLYYNEPSDLKQNQLAFEFFLELWSQKMSLTEKQRKKYSRDMVAIKTKRAISAPSRFP